MNDVRILYMQLQRVTTPSEFDDVTSTVEFNSLFEDTGTRRMVIVSEIVYCFANFISYVSFSLTTSQPLCKV